MLHAVVMAGGSGTRFWPESRRARPKQLLPITGGEAMIVETIRRLDPLIPVERVWVVTNALQEAGVRALCPELPPEQIVVEPCGRNTAACACLAATLIAAVDADATLAVLPADHRISPTDAFQRSLVAGAEAATEQGVLVTFGIVPDHPATGYGYIQEGSACGEHQGIPCHRVDSFHEKPDAARAASYLESGDFLWNAGIFVWRARSILDAFAALQPTIASALAPLGGLSAQERGPFLAGVYPGLDALPVDVAILERHPEVRVLRAPYQWSDLGSWKALYDELTKDAAGNVTVFPAGGRLVTEEATGILAYARTPRTIAVLGLDDVVVVDSGDALLVASRAHAEQVKKIVDSLQDIGAEELL